MGAETALGEIINTGTLGALLVVSLLTNAFLYKETRKEQSAHMETIKEYTNKNGLFIEESRETLKNVLTLLRGNQK
jgi:hypothetical protein